MNNNRSERGQSLVEIALSLTFLLILVSGVVDLGRIFFSYVALRDAAQEGAAYASICPADTTGIEDRVRTTSNIPVNLQDPNITVTVTQLGAGQVGDGIEVTVTFSNFPLITPFMGAILGSQTLTLRADQIDTILRSDC